MGHADMILGMKISMDHKRIFFKSILQRWENATQIWFLQI